MKRLKGGRWRQNKSRLAVQIAQIDKANIKKTMFLFKVHLKEADVRYLGMILIGRYLLALSLMLLAKLILSHIVDIVLKAFIRVLSELEMLRLFW